jgi:hypothetical protein
MQQVDRTLTAQEKADLREFLDHYGEDIIGHYPPTLIFPFEPPADAYYYQAQGQEVPKSPSKPWYKQPEIVAMLVAISAIWIILAFYPY